MKIRIDGLNDLNLLIRDMESQQKYVQSLNGQEIDLKTHRTFSQGPHLHQDGENMSEQESAKFEVDNKKIFDLLRDIENKFREIIRQ